MDTIFPGKTAYFRENQKKNAIFLIFLIFSLAFCKKADILCYY